MWENGEVTHDFPISSELKTQIHLCRLITDIWWKTPYVWLLRSKVNDLLRNADSLLGRMSCPAH